MIWLCLTIAGILCLFLQKLKLAAALLVAAVLWEMIVHRYLARKSRE
jgi:hypothetical protein